MKINRKEKDSNEKYRPQVKKHEENHGQKILDRLMKKKWWWRAK